MFVGRHVETRVNLNKIHTRSHHTPVTFCFPAKQIKHSPNIENIINPRCCYSRVVIRIEKSTKLIASSAIVKLTPFRGDSPSVLFSRGAAEGKYNAPRESEV